MFLPEGRLTINLSTIVGIIVLIKVIVFHLFILLGHLLF